MRLQRLRYEFILQATQPIAHHAEVMGNEAILMRESVRQRGGGFAEVPVITGDTMRHGIREAAAYALLDAAGMLDEPGLSEAALRLLFAGGTVTGKGDAGAISLDLYREMTELIPSLRLLGGCTNSRVIPGQINVDSAVLLCSETEHMMAQSSSWILDWLREQKEDLASCRAHVAEEQRVRMDPTLVPEKRLLLSEGSQVSANRRLAASEAAHDASDSAMQVKEKSTMLPRRFEVVKRGSMFAWGFEARCYSPLDVDTLHVAAAAFLDSMTVGGKRGTGHGSLRPIVGRDIEMPMMARPTTELASGFGPKVGDVFREHVTSRAERIRELCKRVDA